jgi:hypothetical protein
LEGNNAIQNRKTKRMMLKNEMPNSLPSGSGLLMKSGPARESGGTLYSNLADGKSIPVFSAVVSTTGSRDFCLVTVLGNAALPKVVVPHHSFAITHTPINGEVVYIGNLAFGEGPLPRANIAWAGSNGRAAAIGSGPSAFSGANARLRSGCRPPSPPSPPTPPVRHRGTVSRIHSSGRFSEIIEDGTGLRYFAHATAFRTARMVSGARVTFKECSTPKGLAATDIHSSN